MQVGVIASLAAGKEDACLFPEPFVNDEADRPQMRDIN